MLKPKFKAPNNEKLQEFAHVFVQKEITRGIGQEGVDACFIIGIQLDKVLPFYYKYAELVANVEIQMERVKAYFGEHWHRLSNGQRRTIEAAIRREAEITSKQIEGHIKYLENNRQHMETLGPKGQQVLSQKMTEILGWSVEGEENQDELLNESHRADAIKIQSALRAASYQVEHLQTAEVLWMQYSDEHNDEAWADLPSTNEEIVEALEAYLMQEVEAQRLVHNDVAAAYGFVS